MELLWNDLKQWKQAHIKTFCRETRINFQPVAFQTNSGKYFSAFTFRKSLLFLCTVVPPQTKDWIICHYFYRCSVTIQRTNSNMDISRSPEKNVCTKFTIILALQHISNTTISFPLSNMDQWLPLASSFQYMERLHQVGAVFHRQSMR